MAVEDAYEFYPCLVDDAPASIYVNLRFEHDPPSLGDTRYTVAIHMRERGEHGIGTADEAEALNVIEEAVIARARSLAITYVGRLRTRGIWETVLYGPVGHVDALRTLARELAGDRTIDARSVLDASWSYYRELLLPDAERLQWMDDRRMVQILSELGDHLATPRRVDHRLAFATVASRDAVISAVTSLGFTPDRTEDRTDGELPHCAHVHRVDPIELDHIHDVVMVLADAATLQGGRYERWEAGITT
jgi:hypothetical protein